MNVNAHDNQLSRNTPLHWAASFGDVDTIICLIGKYIAPHLHFFNVILLKSLFYNETILNINDLFAVF